MSSVLGNYLICHEKYIDFLGEKILDYGCGKGSITSFIKMLRKDSLIYGYDPDNHKIENAKKKKLWQNISFINSLTDVGGKKFDSVLSSFVLHETGFPLVNEMKSFLMPGGYLIVLDHDKKGICLGDFKRCLTNQDKREHNGTPLKDIWKQHTQSGLEDCISFAEANGFKTVKAYSHKDLNFGAYLWIGKFC